MATTICERNLQDLGLPWQEVVDDMLDVERQRQGLPPLSPAVEWCAEHGWQVIVDESSAPGFVGRIWIAALACGDEAADASGDDWVE